MVKPSKATRPAGALLVVFLLAGGVAFAQSPAVSQKDAASARAQQEQQIAQPLNNQPVWSEIRSGAPQVTQVRGRETNVLIQPQGQTWRAAHVLLVSIGGSIVVLALLGLAGFYLIRGELKGDGTRRGKMIERFSPPDRWAHWLLAITWVALAITGLIMSLGKTILLPLIGYTLFSWLAILSKTVHNFIGPVLIVAVPWLFIRFVRNNGIGMDDLRWFVNIAGYFKGHEYPSHKFNAGEKLVFWFVLVVLSTILIVTGLVLVFPNFDQGRQAMQLANLVHIAAAYAAIGLALVHVYLGTIGMEGAYRAMRYGYVDESWAQHHHLRWYEDVMGGKSHEKVVDVSAAPPEALGQQKVAAPRSPKPAV